MVASAPPAARTVRAPIQNRLIIVGCASAAPSLMMSSAFHRFRHIADEGDHSLSTSHRQAL
jgi:hypothetical protein